jgi:aminoglycoside phosphotransferase (APT) family kinase protein
MGRIAGEIAGIQAELTDLESLVGLYTGKLDADKRESGRLYHELLGAAAELWHELDESARQIAASASQASDVADPRGLIPALNSLLAKAYPELGGDSVVDMIPLRGGGTKLTALIKLRPNPVFATNLVLRKDVADGQTATVAADEYELLVMLSNRGVRVPRPVLAERDPAVLGTPFIIMEEVSDTVTAGHLFPTGLIPGCRNPLSADFVDEVAESLARLHGITEENEPKLARREYANQASVNDFHQLWQSMPKPPLSIAADLGFSWLVNNPLPDIRPRTMVHGDVSLANMLARDGHLAAMLDWELAHFGDPAEDLGYARTYFIDPLQAWTPFVEAYRAAGGSTIACDPFAVQWYSIWGHVRNTVYISGLRDLVMRGIRDDVAAVDGCTTLYAEVQRILLDELARATAEFGAAS